MKSESGLLDGKAVVVTGAGSGLGRAYALHAAHHGASVIVNDIDAGRANAVAFELTSVGLPAVSAPGDVSDWEFSGEIISRCVHEYGHIDGLVSNAGIMYKSKPWEDDGDSVERLIRVNLLGALFGGIHAMRSMVAQGRGSIVNVVSGSQLGLSTMGAYGASKGGIASATYSWSVDLRGTGVRVNAVSPLAQTNMGSPSTRLPGSSSRPPLPAPDHVAPVVTYLLSDLSSSLMGQVLRLEGPHLSIMAHPAISALKVSQHSWTAEEIAAAVSGPLAGDIQHVGRD